MYANHANQNGPNTWALNWNETIELGKLAHAPDPSRNYLLPLAQWESIETARIVSARAGTLTLTNFMVRSDNDYRLNFAPTGVVGMDYHRGLALSTIDRDNDAWEIIALQSHEVSDGTIHVAICA